MLVCPACSFQEEYQPGYRVGTLRPCGRCGLFSLLYLCDKCRIIGLRKSTVPTECSCGSKLNTTITSLDVACRNTAATIGSVTFIMLVVGYFAVERQLPLLFDDLPWGFIAHLDPESFLDYIFYAVINAGLAWAIARVVYRVKGRRLKKELSDSFDNSKGKVAKGVTRSTSEYISEEDFASDTKYAFSKPSHLPWFYSQSESDQKRLIRLTQDFVKYTKVSGGYSAIIYLNSRISYDWDDTDISCFTEFCNSADAEEKAIKAFEDLDPESKENTDFPFERLLEISMHFPSSQD